MRVMWSGEISFGLVSIPIRLHTATKDLAPHFNYLHKVCGTRIESVRRCPHCKVDVAWEDVGKGYRISKGRYALFTKKELDDLSEGESEDSKSVVDIVEFIDPRELDAAYVMRSYWASPSGKTARGYELLRRVLEDTDRIALARVRLRTRTHLAVVRPREGKLAMDVMRFPDEIVSGSEIVIPATREANAKELALAKNLVEEMTAEFDPKKHPDEYRAAVQAAVDEKIEAQDIAEGEEREPSERKEGTGKVLDLTEMLRRSLKGGVKSTRAPRKAVAAKTGSTNGSKKRAAGGSKKSESAAASPKKRQAARRG